MTMSDAQPRAEQEQAPLEYRSASVGEVRFKDRIISVICAPYEQPAVVPFAGGIWEEIYQRGAFESAQEAPHRIRANREHDRARTLGKVERFVDVPDGLVSEVRIAKTPLGDETLTLADEDCLGASLCFGVPQGGQKLDRINKVRRIVKGFMRHVAFVEDPAYKGAQILSVRHDETPDYDERESGLVTPRLDAAVADLAEVMRIAAERRARRT